MSHARCADCDRPLTRIDIDAMAEINAEYRHYGAEAPYDLTSDDGPADLHCADCLERQAEEAQERRDRDYYGGSGPATETERIVAVASLKRSLRGY